MSDTIEQAIASLNNETLSEQEREKVILRLEETATPQAIEALIGALRDRDSGVRWAASQALARLGEPAVRPLLLAMTKPNTDLFFIETARHVFVNNSSERVKQRTKDLVAATHKVGAQVLVMQEANRLLIQGV